MLYLLTGDVQTGKTRWLQKLIEELEANSVTPYGVIAPGRWIEHQSGTTVRFEKTGIDNELLPQHELIPFARRASDVDDGEAQLACSQARKAQLGWAIDDNALDRVNEHFAWVARITADSSEAQENGIKRSKALLIIDELGPLEILHGNGLVDGLALVERGATHALPHALVVVREQLLEQAKTRFINAPWEGIQAILPTNEAYDLLFTQLGIEPDAT